MIGGRGKNSRKRRCETAGTKQTPREQEGKGADRQAPGKQEGRQRSRAPRCQACRRGGRQAVRETRRQQTGRQAGGQTAAGRSLGDGAECVRPPPPASGSVLCRQPTRAEVSARQPAPCVRQRLALHHTVFHSVATDQGSPARTPHQTCDFSQCACVLSQPPLQPHVHVLPSRAWINTGHKRGSNIPPPTPGHPPATLGLPPPFPLIHTPSGHSKQQVLRLRPLLGAALSLQSGDREALGS